ncbi:MAG: RNA 2',3'-cyclic phosphodiesterase [Planctomycetes bacterium]|jgi:2'-5' RNA ligase|nr:RNA 2',3'-cyclic phosphodiesterase [Planctomycetota bacterium]
MRCFIAIDIPGDIRAELADLQKELAGQVDVRKGDVKWVEPESMHLTLKFLGEVPDNQIVEVCNLAKDVASRHSEFDFTVRAAGSFGGRSARVLWVGAGLDCPELLELQQNLEDELADAGWPKEGRQFSGHLTLCRIRNSRAGEELGKLIERYQDYDLGIVHAGSIIVFESQLTGQGPLYTPLGTYRLQER